MSAVDMGFAAAVVVLLMATCLATRLRPTWPVVAVVGESALAA